MDYNQIIETNDNLKSIVNSLESLLGSEGTYKFIQKFSSKLQNEPDKFLEIFSEFTNK